MASERLESAEKIARMTEWNEIEPWEYTEAEGHPPDSLAAAKRFLSAQSFLLSWQEGKVPTAWRRPRRLADFDGKYPEAVVDAAEAIIAEGIAERNLEKTARLNAVISSRGKNKLSDSGSSPENMVKKGVLSENKIDDGNATVPEKKQLKTLNKVDLEALKADFSKFNQDFFEAKSALMKATAALSDVTLRLDAITESLQSA